MDALSELVCGLEAVSRSCDCSLKLRKLSARVTELENELCFHQLGQLNSSGNSSRSSGRNSGRISDRSSGRSNGRSNAVINRNRKRHRQCYNCGQRNHIAKNCVEEIGIRNVRRMLKNSVNVLLLDAVLVEDMIQLYSELGCNRRKLLDLLEEYSLDSVENLEVLNVVCSGDIECCEAVNSYNVRYNGKCDSDYVETTAVNKMCWVKEENNGREDEPVKYVIRNCDLNNNNGVYGNRGRSRLGSVYNDCWRNRKGGSVSSSNSYSSIESWKSIKSNWRERRKNSQQPQMEYVNLNIYE